MEILHTPDGWPRQTPAEVVVDLGDQIDDIPDVVIDHAVVLADVAGSPEKPTSIPRAPSSVATACIYVADVIIRGKHRMVQPEICEEAGVHERTLRNTHPDVPQSFIDGAEQEDIDRLDSRFWDAIQAFAAADNMTPIMNEDTHRIRDEAGVDGMTRGLLDLHDEKLGL